MSFPTTYWTTISAQATMFLSDAAVANPVGTIIGGAVACIMLAMFLRTFIH